MKFISNLIDHTIDSDQKSLSKIWKEVNIKY